ncbi:hypothetical protein C6P86_23525 [Burkholderia multivorans]|nr:hypothetical protein C6P86_23525 [Burkholderia multivorans]PRE77052.1 hypothetical protein C6Q00_27450 [Burkholderia multivorans]PRG17268.1 hypothetical protein C6T57_26145 [Burkholderia multivorans]
MKAYQDVANLEAYRWLLLQHELKSDDERQVELELWVPAMTAGFNTVSWSATVGNRVVPDSNFGGLAVRYQPATVLLEEFASGFRLF